MAVTSEISQLTLEAALKMIAAGIAAADGSGRPQCLIVVDTRCLVLAAVRMDGSKVLSFETATAKARTAASNNAPSGGLPVEFATNLAMASGGNVTNLVGGLPVRFGERLAGAVGVGSGTPAQDLVVARAMLAAVGADEVAGPA